MSVCSGCSEYLGEFVGSSSGGGGGILRGSGEIVGDLRIRAVLCDGGSWVVVWSERKWVGSCRLCL